MIDLHTHSTFSDGTDSPEELIALAERMNLKAIALCDHNSADGLLPFLAAGEKASVHAVAGVEFSTEYLGRELHILGLFIKPEAFDQVMEITDAFRKRKRESNYQLIQRLSESGYVLDYSELEEFAQSRYINRAHIGALLTRKGYTESIKQAFKTLLNEKNGLYVPPERPSAFAIIEQIRNMRAVPVLAHPFLNLDEAELRVFLEKAVSHGLIGMETQYPLYDAAQMELSRKIAEEYGLVESGGSDYHGDNKPHIAMGTGMNNLCIADDIYDRLLEISNAM